MWKKIWEALFGVKHDPYYRAQVEEMVAQDAYLPRMLQYWANGLVQFGLLVTFLLLPGGPFQSMRRTGYVSLYTFLLISALVCGLLVWRLRGRAARKQNAVQTVYAILVCAWSVGIGVMDLKGRGAVTVFCYMLPSIAALSMLSLRRAVAIFSGTELVMLTVLAVMPEGREDLFNLVVNTLCATFVSFLIAGWQYGIRCQLSYETLMLQQAAITDQLTGLYNRRYMDTVVAQALLAATGASGIMLDVDQFKQYNDTMGHQAGDNCLQAIGKTIADRLSRLDAYGIRYGGEEFFICCTSLDVDAAALAEELRRSVEALNIVGHAGELVTVSVGASTGQRGPCALEHLIAQADAALYQAKAQGGNTVVVLPQTKA